MPGVGQYVRGRDDKKMAPARGVPGLYRPGTAPVGSKLVGILRHAFEMVHADLPSGAEQPAFRPQSQSAPSPNCAQSQSWAFSNMLSG